MFLQKYLFCKKRQNILICQLFHKGGGEDFDDVLDELGGLGKSNLSLVSQTKQILKTTEEMQIKLREITANHNVDDRKIPKATPLLAPWPSLPHHAFSVASPGSIPPSTFCLLCFLSQPCLCPNFVTCLPILKRKAN